MPISRSAKKSRRVAERRALENQRLRIRLKNALRRFSPKTFPQVVSLIDKAAKNHLIHQNKAARMKSNLGKLVVATDTPAPSSQAKRGRRRPAARSLKAAPPRRKAKA